MESLNADTFYEIAKELPIDIILNLCQINKQFATLCNDEAFWKERLYHDYPKYKEKIVNYKNTYLDLAKKYIKMVRVYLFLIQNGIVTLRPIGSVWLHKGISKKETMNVVKQLYEHIIPKEEQYTNWYLSSNFIEINDNTFIDGWNKISTVTINNV